MYTFKLTSIVLFPLSIFAATQAPESTAEVWLMNCVDNGGAKYSELAMYPAFPDGYPLSTVTVATRHNTTIAWEVARLAEQLPGGTVFESSQFGLAKAGEAAGLVKLGQHDLTCSPYAIDALYTTTDQSVCSAVYQCQPQQTEATPIQAAAAASSPQTVLSAAPVALDSTSDSTLIRFNPFDAKAIVSGHLTAGDIFWNVWDNRDDAFFSGREVRFGTDGCTVRYEGHGDIPWATTNGLANTLLTVASSDKFLQYSTYKKRECETTCEDPRRRGVQTCCAYAMNTYSQTHIPAEVQFQVINEPPAGSGRNPSDQGSLTYFITCPVKQSWGCTLCKIFEDILSGGGQVGGEEAISKTLAKGFGVANVVATVGCQIAGC